MSQTGSVAFRGRSGSGPRVKLPRDVDGRQAARALQRIGFVQQRQTGSYLILRREGRTVVVPQHKPLKPGTLKGIIDQAGLTIEEFKANL